MPKPDERSADPPPPLSDRVLAALAGMPPTARVGDLAERLGMPAGDLAKALRTMRGVEFWRDESSGGSLVVMLSESSLSKLGLALSRGGGRWVPARRIDSS